MACNYIQTNVSHQNGMETEQAFLRARKSLTRSIPETEFYPLCVYFKTGRVILKHGGDVVLGKEREKTQIVDYHLLKVCTAYQTHLSCKFNGGAGRDHRDFSLNWPLTLLNCLTIS